MTYLVKSDGSDLENINLNPESEIDEVLQNVAMILATPKFTVPLMRDFGLPMQFLDRPENVAMSVMIGEIYDSIEQHEPRTKIENITFEKKESCLVAVVEVSINE